VFSSNSRVDEAVRSINDINHQSPHFVVVQARAFVQGIAPYGLLTMTSEQSPDADDGEMPHEDPQASSCGSTARPDISLNAAEARDLP
jgi:hypothetical protein